MVVLCGDLCLFLTLSNTQTTNQVNDIKAHIKASSNLKINSTLKSTFIVNLQIVFFVSNQAQLGIFFISVQSNQVEFHCIYRVHFRLNPTPSIFLVQFSIVVPVNESL
jgi:hypothetical protein